MQSGSGTVVVLGTGGTIAGTAASPGETVAYRAAQLGVQALLDAAPPLRGMALEAEQLAQVDSKDMDFELWRLLARRAAFHLARPEVAGLVVTHGTDTLEETAYFLHRVLAPAKPLVLTAAMRPATSLQADGPQNLCDAAAVAVCPGACGVVAVIAGRVYSGAELRKVHTCDLDAFTAGDAGPLALLQAGRLRLLRPWPQGRAIGLVAIDRPAAEWPRVEIVLNHVGADGRIVDALLAQGVDGLVLAGTGNGSLSHALHAAALRAQAAGVAVLRATRCAAGPVVGGEVALHAAGTLSAAQARVELLLRGLTGRSPAPAPSPR